jgi:predicted phage-related endonuclease
MATAVLQSERGLSEYDLKLRENYLGASESAAVMGYNPWCHASDIYHQRVDGIVRPSTEMMRMGQIMEPFILERASDELGVSLTQANRRRVHPEAPLQATVDSFVRGRNEIIEAKLVHPFSFKKGQADPNSPDRWGDPYTDAVPRYYLIQVQHQLAVLTESTQEPWDLAYVAVMIGIEEFRLYRVPRHPQLGQQIVDAVSKFWTDHILVKVPPIDDGPSPETLAQLPRDAGKVVEGVDAKLIPEYEQAHEDVKIAEGRKELARGKIIKAMGDAEAVVDTAGRRATYRTIVSNKLDAAALKAAQPI